MTIDDIDFAALYRQHMARAERQPKPASAWDARAEALGRKPLGGIYAETFLSRMDLTGSRSLLDVGCGPGTIGLLLADRLEQVIGMDYSPAMLEQLENNARHLGLDNVTPLLCAWEDDWHDVPRCDIVVASRSGMVTELQDALAKLNAHARQRVYMTQLVGGHFIDADLTALLGRQRASVPDYVYAVNLLHAQGIHPRLSYIEVPSRLAGTRDFDEFAQRVAWSLGELTTEEAARLKTWYDANPERAAAGGTPLRWALIDWDVVQRS
ncbi:Methyltransferase domain-containing protein [Modicisalibacter ilicicola DSM 19980]|uniref:Methyltransferase domain-containing protein n=1 Tax=Modicisalibacter ilicicola DSM 19980 TaxID=1121942 RepID=A0A1M4SHL3_9GAMM|nr:methyltransferase domain-containing protein [Halomonas ilicicola]SHE31691.1 Methyltransferase domain-containing protein [Halomonas ilicicola DSM 19980]